MSDTPSYPGPDFDWKKEAEHYRAEMERYRDMWEKRVRQVESLSERIEQLEGELIRDYNALQEISECGHDDCDMCDLHLRIADKAISQSGKPHFEWMDDIHRQAQEHMEARIGKLERALCWTLTYIHNPYSKITAAHDLFNIKWKSVLELVEPVEQPRSDEGKE